MIYKKRYQPISIYCCSNLYPGTKSQVTEDRYEFHGTSLIKAIEFLKQHQEEIHNGTMVIWDNYEFLPSDSIVFIFRREEDVTKHGTPVKDVIRFLEYLMNY